MGLTWELSNVSMNLPLSRGTRRVMLHSANWMPYVRPRYADFKCPLRNVLPLRKSRETQYQTESFLRKIIRVVTERNDIVKNHGAGYGYVLNCKNGRFRALNRSRLTLEERCRSCCAARHRRRGGNQCKDLNARVAPISTASDGCFVRCPSDVVFHDAQLCYRATVLRPNSGACCITRQGEVLRRHLAVLLFCKHTVFLSSIK